MKRIIVLSILALLIAIPFIIADVDAVPSDDICSNCHNDYASMWLFVGLMNCVDNDAYYEVIVEDIPDATEGWAVFNNGTNTGQNAVGNYGQFIVQDGGLYDMQVASVGNYGISNSLSFSPDCSIFNCTDGDGDYYNAEGGPVCGPVDCDDSDPEINPGAEEDCTNGIDDDCDDLIDAADPDAVNCPPTCTDADGDLYSVEGGDCGSIDCDDLNWYINPGAIENCIGGIDDDCDDKVDCDDSDCVGNPACPTCVPEICDDGIDNDCDNKIDCRDKPDCKKDPAC
jgi:hypothetical protein